MSSIADLPGDLLHYYLEGGAVMHMISLLSLASITTIIYKLISFRQVKLDLNEFISKVRGSLLKGNVQGAMGVCEEHRGPVASIVKTGLLKYGKPRDEIEKTMENAAIHEVAHLEKYLTVLATIANIAPLLGFLGTVVGMILSFEVIAEQGHFAGRVKPTPTRQGIYATAPSGRLSASVKSMQTGPSGWWQRRRSQRSRG